MRRRTRQAAARQEALGFNDDVEQTAGIPDPDFGRIANNNLPLENYQRPRTVRFSARWAFSG